MCLSSVIEMPEKQTYSTALGAHFSCWPQGAFLPLYKTQMGTNSSAKNNSFLRLFTKRNEMSELPLFQLVQVSH